MIQRNDLLVGYVNQVLSPDQREKVEQMLRESVEARAELSELRQIQRAIDHGIRAELDYVLLPETMSYAAIATQVGRRPSRRITPSNRWLANVSAFAAAIALIGALMFSLGSSNNSGITQGAGQIEPASVTVTATPEASLPTLPEVPSTNIEYNSSLPRRGADSPTIPTRTPTPVQDSFIQPEDS